MMKKSTKYVVDNHLCISCGICEAFTDCDMVYRKGIRLPSFDSLETIKQSETVYSYCPGKGYPIVELGNDLYRSSNTKNDFRTGIYLSIGAARSTKTDLLKNSSSGAMIPTIALHMLESNVVQGIVTVKYRYSSNGPIPEPFIATTKEHLILSQGSKYQPVSLLSIMSEIHEFDGVLAVIGTPCQIAGIRLMQQTDAALKNKILFTISNFCGGFRDYRETEQIFDLNKVEKNRIRFFSYRGIDQPGQMTIKQVGRDDVVLPYPDYSRLTGHRKYHRCKVCIDATGELADVAFGDAWLPRYLKSEYKWSLYIVRSKEIEKILLDMEKQSQIVIEEVGLENLALSQKGNISTKKIRQRSRYHLYRALRKAVPIFDGGYSKADINVWQELKIDFIQYVMYLLELAGLYHSVAKLMKRIK
jgi:coenzyme F420 hydrogenase subunit beta